MRQVAQGCLEKAKDLAGLLLLHSASGSAQGMDALQALAGAEGKHNVEFLAAFLMGRLSQCVDILVNTNRLPEAAFFARTYLPSRISEVGARCQAGCLESVTARPPARERGPLLACSLVVLLLCPLTGVFARGSLPQAPVPLQGSPSRWG